MNTEQFVDAIREVVMKAAARDVFEQLEKPVGRTPAHELVALSTWWHGLSESDRDSVRMFASEVTHAAVFGFLCVLDGVRAIENGSDKGELELSYIKNGERTLLATTFTGLHDLLNSQPWHGKN